MFIMAIYTLPDIQVRLGSFVKPHIVNLLMTLRCEELEYATAWWVDLKIPLHSFNSRISFEKSIQFAIVSNSWSNTSPLGSTKSDDRSLKVVCMSILISPSRALRDRGKQHFLMGRCIFTAIDYSASTRGTGYGYIIQARYILACPYAATLGFVTIGSNFNIIGPRAIGRSCHALGFSNATTWVNDRTFSHKKWHGSTEN